MFENKLWKGINMPQPCFGSKGLTGHLKLWPYGFKFGCAYITSLTLWKLFALLSSGLTGLLELWPCGFKIKYTQLGVISLSSGLTGLLEFWPGGFRIEYTQLSFASPSSGQTCFWNSNYVVLKSSIRSSASPRSAAVQWDGKSKVWRDRRDRTDGRTDRLEGWNSYVDIGAVSFPILVLLMWLSFWDFY